MKKYNKIVAIQGDPIQTINTKTDTTGCFYRSGDSVSHQLPSDLAPQRRSTASHCKTKSQGSKATAEELQALMQKYQ